MLTYVAHLHCTVFVDLDVLSLLCGSIHTVHHHPAFFTGPEIFSLSDPVMQSSSCTSVPQQSISHMPRVNVYVICSFSNVQTQSYSTQRNASAREKRMIIIPLKSKYPTASTSRPPNSNATQSSGAAQPESPPRSQAVVSTSSTTPPAVANTTPSTNPHIIIKHAGRWTRFWISICCTSSEYTEDHH
jgi:hypothetical protein